jgi:hypothetical protein
MRVHDLAGAALDLWTAKAAGISNAEIVDGVCLVGGRHHRPSASWSDGGPLIERERISIWRYPDLDSWHACLEFSYEREEGVRAKHYYQGPTPLVAAMRCLIASKFGNDIADG